MNNKIHMSVRADPKIQKWFEDTAKLERHSIAQLMLLAMEEYIKNKQEK